MGTRLFFFIWFFFPGFLFGQVDEVIYTGEDTIRARILFNEAETLVQNRKLNEALEKVSEAKEIFTSILEAESEEVADCWHLLGAIHYYNRNDREAKTAWDKALLIRLNILGEENLDVANSYNNLGLIYVNQGKYREARQVQEKALNIRLNILGESHPKVAYSYNNIGLILIEQGDFDKATECYLTALGIIQNFVGEIHPDVATYYHNLGAIYKKQGKYYNAQDYYSKALEIRLATLGEIHHEVADSYNNLGILFKDQKEYTKAEQYYKKTLEIYLRLENESNPNIATSYNNLGIVKNKQGEYTKAEQYLEKALKIRLKFYSKSHPKIAHTYVNLGNVFKNQEKYDKAIQCHTKALSIQLELFGETHEDVAHSYNNLGNVYSRQTNYAKAIYYHEKALKTRLAIFGDSHPHVAVSYYNLSILYDTLGEFNEAIQLTNKALIALNFSNNQLLYKVNSITNLINILQRKSYLYQKQYSFSKNKTHLYRSYSNIQQAINVLNYWSKNLGESEKTQVVKDALSVFSSATSINYLLFKVTDSLHYSLEAFNFSERSKSFILFSALQESKALSFAGIPDSLLKLEYDLRMDITFYEKQRQEKLFKGINETDTLVLDISGKLLNIERVYEDLKSQFEQEHPNYYHLKFNLNAISVKQVQRELLNSDQTLIEYLVGDSTILIYIVNQDDYQAHEIKKDFPLEEWVKIFRKANDKDHYENDIDNFCQVAHDLYQKLIAPVAENLKEEIIIIPDGILGYIPFEALLVEPVNKYQRFRNHHYLLKDKQISYSYSATLLKQMQDRKHKQKATNDFLAFAPYYDGDSTMLAKLFRYADPKDKKPLKPLPNSGEEVYGIQQIMGGKIYLDSTATEEQFVKSASNYLIIHLATHGKANDKVGDYSYLAFTEQKDSIENELLYVRDLYNLQLNADMVVLSACETGIGELQRGEGIISLARGMTYAGAKSIITSLWSVEDGRTKDIMISFYKHLKNGMTKDAALRQAKLDFINNENNDHPDVHPFYWSGFIGIGDMERLF